MSRDAAHWLLAGFSGAGKSVVGPVLAGLAGRPFVDLDERVAARTGCSIPDLFRGGEERFRQVEAEALAMTLEASAPLVVALGAGALDSPRSRELAARSALVAWIAVPLEECLRRVAASGEIRPVLRDAPPEALRELYERRRAHAGDGPSVDGMASPDRVAAALHAALAAVPGRCP